jgi:hypothetical protein
MAPPLSFEQDFTTAARPGETLLNRFKPIQNAKCLVQKSVDTLHAMRYFRIPRGEVLEPAEFSAALNNGAS